MVVNENSECTCVLPSYLRENHFGANFPKSPATHLGFSPSIYDACANDVDRVVEDDWSDDDGVKVEMSTEL